MDKRLAVFRATKEKRQRDKKRKRFVLYCYGNCYHITQDELKSFRNQLNRFKL